MMDHPSGHQVNKKDPRNHVATERGIDISNQSEKVPKAMAETYAAVTSITDAVCREHLNEEYAQLIRYAAAALCRKRPSPLAKGTPLSWAAGITHAVGMVNFLQDPAQSPHLPAQALYQAFGVSPSNGQTKSKAVRDLLGMGWMDLEWCLPSRLADHPMAWMVFTDNGMMLDARSLAREDQVLLHQAGLIPFVHADQTLATATVDASPAPPDNRRSEPGAPAEGGGPGGGASVLTPA